MKKIKELETRLQNAYIKEQLEKLNKLQNSELNKTTLFELKKIAKNLIESIDILSKM